MSTMNKYKNLKFKPTRNLIDHSFFFFSGKDIQDSNVRIIMSELFIMSSDACCILLVYFIDQTRT